MSWFSRILRRGEDGEAAGATALRPVSLADARLVIDRHEFALVELGVRSFRAYPYEGDLIERQNFTFVLTLPDDGSDGGEECRIFGRGVVRHVNAKEGLVAQFNAPQPALDRKLMAFLVRIGYRGHPHAAHVAHPKSG